MWEALGLDGSEMGYGWSVSTSVWTDRHFWKVLLKGGTYLGCPWCDDLMPEAVAEESGSAARRLGGSQYGVCRFTSLWRKKNIINSHTPFVVLRIKEQALSTVNICELEVCCVDEWELRPLNVSKVPQYVDT